jgi:hypothetical protein
LNLLKTLVYCEQTFDVRRYKKKWV